MIHRQLQIVTVYIRALSTLRGLRGAPEVPPLCRETQSLGQQMLKEPLGINIYICSGHEVMFGLGNEVNEVGEGS